MFAAMCIFLVVVSAIVGNVVIIAHLAIKHGYDRAIPLGLVTSTILIVLVLFAAIEWDENRDR